MKAKQIMAVWQKTIVTADDKMSRCYFHLKPEVWPQEILYGPVHLYCMFFWESDYENRGVTTPKWFRKLCSEKYKLCYGLGGGNHTQNEQKTHNVEKKILSLPYGYFIFFCSIGYENQVIAV